MGRSNPRLLVLALVHEAQRKAILPAIDIYLFSTTKLRTRSSRKVGLKGQFLKAQCHFHGTAALTFDDEIPSSRNRSEESLGRTQ